MLRVLRQTSDRGRQVCIEMYGPGATRNQGAAPSQAGQFHAIMIENDWLRRHSIPDTSINPLLHPHCDLSRIWLSTLWRQTLKVSSNCSASTSLNHVRVFFASKYPDLAGSKVLPQSPEFSQIRFDSKSFAIPVRNSLTGHPSSYNRSNTITQHPAIGKKPGKHRFFIVKRISRIPPDKSPQSSGNSQSSQII